MQTEFQTSRLSLRLIDENDAAFVLAILNTPGWLEFIGDRNVHSLEDALHYIQKLKNTPRLSYWVARLTHSEIPIGIISFMKRDYLAFFDIGFALLPEFWGQGYAYEAAKAILESARQHPEHTTILATVRPHNAPSIQLLKRLGLTFRQEIQEASLILQVYGIEKKA